MKNRLYCIPGYLLSKLLSISPSFTLSAVILKIFNPNVSKDISVHSGVRFIIPTRLSIGSGTTLNGESIIDSRCGINIGCNTMIGRGVKLFTLGHDIDDPNFKSVGGPINIGSHVVIFPYSIIMPGISIGDNAVIYPGSIVTNDVPSNSVVGGTPAKFIKSRAAMNYQLSYKIYFGV